jgi:hypothetical protein
MIKRKHEVLSAVALAVMVVFWTWQIVLYLSR